MLERLVESWLDNASERSYQPCFCQMLVAQGYAIVHSTRHSPIEYGKDVIAIAPDGVPCAFQLKGNPNSRLTQSQMRDIQGQLVQLATQAIVYPGVPAVPHRSYLVTNGEVDEEAVRIISDMNLGFQQAGLRTNIEIIQRGQLLRWGIDLGAALWPKEIADIDCLLRLMTSNGRDLFSLPRLHDLLQALMGLGEKHEGYGAAELRRRVFSSALLTAIGLREYERSENHFAKVTAWVMFVTYTIGACNRYGVECRDSIAEAIAVAESQAYAALCDLWSECSQNEHLVEGNILSDWAVYRWRYTLVVSLISVLWFWMQEKEPQRWESENEKLVAFLLRRHKYLELWGEAAVPQLLTFIWFLRNRDATMRPDLELVSLLQLIVTANQHESKKSLASPYHEFQEVARNRLGLDQIRLLGMQREESFEGGAFFARSVMLLLARANLKQYCRSNWADCSKLAHKAYYPDDCWQFCLWRSDKGAEKTYLFPLTYQWTDLVAAARDSSCKCAPESLLERKFMLLLWVIVVPYRGVPEIVRHLGAAFTHGW